MKNIFKILILTMVIAVILPTATFAGTIYKWVDDEGVTNFTDDEEKVPVEYRDQLEEFDMTPVIKSKTVPSKKPAVVEKVKPSEKLYGKYTVREWSDLFKQKYREIAGVEKRIEVAKDFIVVYERSLRLRDHYLAEKKRTGSDFNVQALELSLFSEAEMKKYEAYRKELPRLENQLSSIEAELTEMKRKATYYGVPKKVRAGEQ